MAKKKVKPVVKPYLLGTWHSKYATRKGYKLMLSILFVSFLYLLLGVLLSFDSLTLRILTSVIIVTVATMYMFFQGANSGEADTAFSEIMYQHKEDGKEVVQTDYERCYHPAKGLYSVLVALIPYLLVTLVFAFLVQPITYSLGVLPSWLETPAQQTHVNEALAYYETLEMDVFMSVLRILARAITMPFINVSLLLGTNGGTMGREVNADLGDDCPACLWPWVYARPETPYKNQYRNCNRYAEEKA